MNQFYLNNSYIPLLDFVELLPDSQQIVYFKLGTDVAEYSANQSPGQEAESPPDQGNSAQDEVINPAQEQVIEQFEALQEAESDQGGQGSGY